jgi:hypothetical protein
MTRDQVLREAIKCLDASLERAQQENGHYQYIYGLEDAIEIVNDLRAQIKFIETVNGKL